jgi:hypothetical protein
LTAIANLSVKKNDGVTDIIWTALQGQGGNQSPALWASQTLGTSLSHQPTLTMLAKDSGDGATRRTNLQVIYPHLVTDGANTTVQRKGQVDVSCAYPKDMNSDQWKECISQAINLLVALKNDLKSGTAPV